MLDIIQKFIGTKHEREIKRMRPMVAAVGALEPKMKALSDGDIVALTAQFRERVDRGESLDSIAVEAFAACREGARRALGMRHYDVQLIGGMVLHQGKIAEMKTGEGKTLVATLACYLNALSGKGVHVVTVNDYLARRDAEWMGKVYGFMGLSTGVIHHGQNNAQKSRAYACDITYGQNNEFGFDYLRDNMKFSIFDYVQRDLNFAIVDEVDSILIDEARTPLIISGPGETASELYMKINQLVPKLRKDEHYEVDEKSRQVTFTEDGMETAQGLLHRQGLTEVENLYDPVNLPVLHILQQSLRAHVLYKRDQHYMVSPDGQVMIIDEFTGRTLAGRRWSDGLHQAIEAKEHVTIEDENITLATISFQNLFRLYDKLSGMTGTADTEAAEFHKIYNLDVVVVPTNRPIARADEEDLIYKSEREKFKAIIGEIAESHGRGQPVLVGTTSVEKSEVVAMLLEREGIPFQVLNAKQHEREAYVVAQAGQKGAVTVATNMAGRGTDIVLGGNPEMLARLEVLEEAGKSGKEVTPEEVDTLVEQRTEKFVTQCRQEKKEVLDLGGLRIVGTERHESRRIDNQLRGRSGRQGDPGSSRFYLSLEDDLMRIFAGERLQVMMDRMGMEEDVPIEHKWVTKAVENSQTKVEERNFDIRKNMLEYDDVMNQQRKSMYTLRRQILMGQYRTVPTEAQVKKGVKPEPVVEAVDPQLEAASRPTVEQMVQIHGAEIPDGGVAREDVPAYRKRAYGTPIAELGTVRADPLERDIYMWFGCRLHLSSLAEEPERLFEHVLEAASLSLTEQRERLLDLTDEMVGEMVSQSCPANQHFEDWDVEGLAKRYEDQFGIEGSGITGASDAREIAEKLYKDAEAVLFKREQEFGAESFLRLFRNVYMQEIDRQWIDHLQGMDGLRDGIGLRGYGQRDPKREYKREGYNLFLRMIQNVKHSVCQAMYRAEQVDEEELARQEDQRRRQAEARLRAMQTRHTATGALAPDAEEGAPEGANRRLRRRAAKVVAGPGATEAMGSSPAVTVKRGRPKLGRNDPCHCGSGKKYKNCHYRADRAAEAAM